MFQASRESVHCQISEAAQQLAASRGISQQAFALIIDGKSLAYALEDNIKNMFLELAIHCASVICCRSSPKQKALVCVSVFCVSSSLFNIVSSFFGGNSDNSSG